MLKIIAIFIYIYIPFCFGIEVTSKQSRNEKKIYEYSNKINIELDQLKNIKSEEYVEKVQIIRSNLKNYFEHKKRVCQGEFSALILDGAAGIINKRKKRKKVRLTKKEKALCYLEMKNMQESYILGSYEARRKFLIDLHEKKMKELEKLKNDSLYNLKKTFN